MHAVFVTRASIHHINNTRSNPFPNTEQHTSQASLLLDSIATHQALLRTTTEAEAGMQSELSPKSSAGGSKLTVAPPPLPYLLPSLDTHDPPSLGTGARVEGACCCPDLPRLQAWKFSRSRRGSLALGESVSAAAQALEPSPLEPGLDPADG